MAPRIGLGSQPNYTIPTVILESQLRELPLRRRLAEALRARLLSDRALCTHIGMTPRVFCYQTMVARRESRPWMPPYDVAKKIGQFLRVSPDVLFDDTAPPLRSSVPQIPSEWAARARAMSEDRR